MLIDILFINHFTRSYREKNVKARPGFSIALRCLHYISQSLIILMFLVMTIRITRTSVRKKQRHINIHIRHYDYFQLD